MLNKSGKGGRVSGFALLFCEGFSLCFAVPVDGAAQAFFEAYEGFVVQNVAGLRDVRLRVADIAVARWFVLRLQFVSRQIGEQRQGLIQRDARAGADVEYFAGSVWRFTGKKVCRHRTFTKREVA